jgi:hypothetical protein
MCGSSGIYDSINLNGCNVELLTNGVVKKTFNVIQTTVTQSSAGNIKLISSYPSQIVILSDNDLLGLGFANQAAFLTYWSNAMSSCMGSGTPNPTVPIVLNIPQTVLPNAHSEVYTFNVPGVILGGNIVFSPATNINIPVFNTVDIEIWVTDTDTVTVTITNDAGDDITVPPFNYHVFINS